MRTRRNISFNSVEKYTRSQTKVCRASLARAAELESDALKTNFPVRNVLFTLCDVSQMTVILFFFIMENLCDINIEIFKHP